MIKDDEILAMSTDYATHDDFGYTVFRSDDDLLAFAYAVLAELEANLNIRGQHEMQGLRCNID